VEVFVTHPSSDPGRHYIKTIIVSVNDIQVAKQLFSSQGRDGQSATYEIKELRPHDRIKVYAACSVYGDLAKTKTIGP
jgi:desulfoferrodoxin (superoxide reductase-like protein)